MINYIFENLEPDFDKILIENKEYSLGEVNNKEIKINFSEMEKELGSKILAMTLKNSVENSIHYFEVIPGINYGILFPTQGNTRDLIFLDDEVYKVEIICTLFKQKKEFCVKGKRLLLINFTTIYNLFINDISLTNQIIKLSAQEDSSQISVVDLANRIFLSKAVVPLKFGFFFDKYDELKDKARYFSEEIENVLNKNNFTMNEYEDLFFKKELIKIIFYKFNFPKKILLNEYNKKEYFEFISSCSLYFIMSNLKEKEQIKSTYKYFKDYKKRLENDLNLENYMRSLIIIELAMLMEKNNNLDKFKDLDFKYYNTNKLEKYSPLKAAITFLDNFIKNLDEQSPFIYPLILINSGNFIYGQENAYGYGLINHEILKSHLQNAIPDIIITINDQEDSSDQGISNKKLGSVKLNLATKILLPLQYYNINTKMENKEKRDNLGLLLFIILFHEIFRHKKGGFSSTTEDDIEICGSPKVFYDKEQKKILNLVNRNCLYSKYNDVPILRGDGKEDGGYFLEYFIGKCEYGFYSEIIEIMLLNNINLNFIFDVDMWNKNINIMRNYIRLKYIVYIYDKNLLDKKKYSDIGMEIYELENIIKEKKIDLKNVKKLNEIKNIEENGEKEIRDKKSELFRPHKINKIEYERFENYSINDLLNIAIDKGTNEELREIVYNIIFSRILKK